MDSRSKILDYLLSGSHPDAAGKVQFFAAHGFTRFDWGRLAAALCDHAMSHPVRQAVETNFGVRYVIEDALPSPDGRAPQIRSVWFIRTDRDVPEFVTAYPVRLRSSQ